MKKFNTLLCAIFFATQIFSQTVSTFENLTLSPDTFWNGSDLSGSFSSGNANFANDYDTTYSAWSGFVYSNMKDSTTAGYSNQYSAITGAGYNGSANYAIADEYGNAKVRLTGNASGKLVKGFYVTNATYAYLSMKNGDQFAKKFGGVTGTDPDWFRLRAIGWKNGVVKQQAVDFFLADFRSPDTTQHYIVKDWTWFDLQPLGDVDSVLFTLASSDTAFGYMNTPAYFAMDNFTTSDTAYTTPVANDDAVTITYLQDTLIAVLNNDAGLVASPHVELVSTPLIPGATAVVTNNEILYTPAIGIVSTDSFLYRVYDDLGGSDTATVYVNVTGITSVSELQILEPKISPNPFSNSLTVSSSDLISEVQLYNLTGSLVKNISSLGSNQVEFNTESLSSGIYFLKMSSEKETTTMKIVKQ